MSLLERHIRGVRLTEAGAVLLQKVDKLVGELEQIEADMKCLRTPAEEVLRVALPHGAIKLFGSAFIERYQRLRSQTRLHIVEQSSSANRDSVLKGKVDAAMAYEPEQSADLTIQPLLTEPLVVVGPAHSAKTGQAIAYPPSYEGTELARLPLLLPSMPHGYRRIVERFAAPLRVEPNVLLDVEGLPALATLVEHGLGLMISTYSAVSHAIAAGTLVAVPIAAARCEVELSLVHRSDHQMRPSLIAFKKVIAQEVKVLVTDGKCRAACT